MADVLPYLAILACPLGMGLCMWLMSKGMGAHKSPEAPAAPGDLAELRDQHRRLGTQIEQLERSAHDREPVR